MAVEILIKKIILDGGNVRFDLMGRNLPENFLGMAADLKFIGTGAKYERMEWGNAFTGFEPGDLPIKMVKNDWEAGLNEGKIIFGISLKADKLKNPHDGVIGSFYFSGKDLADLQFVGFERAVLSTYENGRVDLTDVKWLDAGQIKMPVEIISAGPIQTFEGEKTPLAQETIKVPMVEESTKNQVVEISNDSIGEAQKLVSAQVLSPAPTIYPDDMSGIELSPENQDVQLSDSQFFWWALPLLIGLPILLLVSWLYWRRQAGNRTWQYSSI